MRSSTSIILGGPIAAWALYGCLTLAGLSWHAAGTIALAWGALWIGLSQLHGLARRISRETRASRRAIRRRLMNAILATLFVPLPVYMLALVLQWFALAPAAVTVIMLATLVVPVPFILWWAVLKPAEPRDAYMLPVLVYQPSRPMHEGAA